MSILSHTVKTEPGNSKDKIHQASTDIAHEFKSFVADIESLIKETASLTGDDLAQAKIKINHRINAAKHHINAASGTMLDQARKTAVRTNEYVHEKPWAIIGTGALVSFVLGMLLGHRDENSAK
jgi:ElaB/YqjD/DUF883 family membrane-anchored ribosome-binding protein